MVESFSLVLLTMPSVVSTSVILRLNCSSHYSILHSLQLTLPSIIIPAPVSSKYFLIMFRPTHLWMVIAALLASAATTKAQKLLSPQTNTFASAASLTQDQLLKAGINETVANNIEVALNFERSNWANGSVDADPFYRPPSNASGAPAGSLLRLQLYPNTSTYTLPPNTALTRFLYQTETLNGTLIPASAFILWPYTPRVEADGYPVVGFAHGTSGGFGNCAPSHVRNLWYQFAATYTLALQGYVVVAPDYTGLGVDHDSKGNGISHPYLAYPSHANDLFYSVQAAQSAFATLSKRFVIMGHSQGGGAAWGAAQRQASRPVEGYLGAIAGSPVTSVHELMRLRAARDVGMLIANGLLDIFPTFNISSFLTPAGIRLYSLISEIQGCNSVIAESFEDPGLYQPAWYDSLYAKKFFNLTTNGGQPIGGPMLVLQGEADLAVLPQVTNQAVNSTCAYYPKSQLQYLTYPGVTHVPVMYASQVTWLNWIADRYAGKAVPDGCNTSRVPSARNYTEYEVEPNWFIELATAAYEVA